MPLLKLVALDREDLEVLSAQLQDAVMQVAGLSYLPKERRFVAIANRFDWAQERPTGRRPEPHQRWRTALRFEHVTAVRRQNIVQTSRDAVLSLLTIRFEEADAPAGAITLIFSGGGALLLIDPAPCRPVIRTF